MRIEVEETINDNVVIYYLGFYDLTCYLNSEEFATKGHKTISEICIRNRHTVTYCELWYKYTCE
jgi:coproporphyrinogen III oxidase